MAARCFCCSTAARMVWRSLECDGFEMPLLVVRSGEKRPAACHRYAAGPPAEGRAGSARVSELAEGMEYYFAAEF